MPGDYLPDDLKNIWKELDTNPIQRKADEVRKEAEMLRKGVGRRSALGGLVCLILMASFTVFFFKFPNGLQRIGCVLTVAGVGYLILQLRMRRSSATPDPGETDCVRFYRAELERQRDFHRGKWFWSRLLIFVPGPIVFMAGFAQAYPKLSSGIRLELAAFLILGVIGVPLNLRLARKYQRRIDALDQSQRTS